MTVGGAVPVEIHVPRQLICRGTWGGVRARLYGSRPPAQLGAPVLGRLRSGKRVGWP
jgi:hypothetical protein